VYFLISVLDILDSYKSEIEIISLEGVNKFTYRCLILSDYISYSVPSKILTTVKMPK